MELDQLFGLPAHPLLVHTPVVIIPLTLLLAIAAVAWARGRSVLSLVVAGAATIGMLGAQLAVMSGEPLEERVVETDLVERHAELGEGARTLAILVFLIAVGFAVREWRGRIPLPGVDRVRALMAPRAIGVALAVALIASSALATLWVVRAGHAGAEATWSDLPAVSQGEHDGDGDD